MEENIRFAAILRGGHKIDINTPANDIFEAMDELRQSICNGDIPDVSMEDVIVVIDIPG